MNKMTPITIKELSEMSDEMMLVASYRPRNSKKYDTRILGYRNGSELVGILSVSEKEYNGPITIRFIDNYLSSLFSQAYQKGINEYIESEVIKNG